MGGEGKERDKEDQTAFQLGVSQTQQLAGYTDKGAGKNEGCSQFNKEAKQLGGRGTDEHFCTC